MAGCEDEAEQVVAYLVVERCVEIRYRRLPSHLELAGELLLLALEHLPAPQPVDRPVLGGAISQAPGLSGTPDSGHCSSAATRASCASSSARPTSRTIRASPAISRADSIRQTASITRWVSEAEPNTTPPYLLASACARMRSSCSLSSGVSSSPKSSASNTWRTSISDSPSIGLGQRLTHSIASSFDLA